MSRAQWGFHPGGWGKPPMDDFNRPLYGDVFGVVQGAEIAHQNEINKDLWGEIEQVDVGAYLILTLSLPSIHRSKRVTFDVICKSTDDQNLKRKKTRTKKKKKRPTAKTWTANPSPPHHPDVCLRAVPKPPQASPRHPVCKVSHRPFLADSRRPTSSTCARIVTGRKVRSPREMQEMQDRGICTRSFRRERRAVVGLWEARRLMMSPGRVGGLGVGRRFWGRMMGER